MQTNQSLSILGTRGIPAQHGGFETFAEYLSLYLVSKGWKVTVYCQEEGEGKIFEDEWQGVRLVHIPVPQKGPLGTIIFDWKSTIHAAKEKSLKLTLGYNTAIFCLSYRLKGITNLINMDGLEWKREKWGLLAKSWFYLNERLGCWLGNHLIADHPKIKEHLASRVPSEKITMIPYGADLVTNADSLLFAFYGLEPNSYALVIARPEPENSIFEIVSAFSKKKRNIKLVLLGRFEPAINDYHRKIVEVASEDVKFLGAIYDKALVQTLRYFCRLYIHGHTVGGTNPSLLEALGAGSAVLAHDNQFNRWVAGPGARYFSDYRECEKVLDEILHDDAQLESMKLASQKRFQEEFTWKDVLKEYEIVLSQWHRDQAAD